MQNNFWFFLLFVIAMTVTPGPGNLAMLALGQTVGFKKSIPFLTGLIAGSVAVTSLVSIGLGALYINSPRTASVFKIISVMYIIYLAIKVVRMNVQTPEEVRPFTIYDGLVLHPLNPKAWATSIAIFSQFADPAEPRFLEIGIFVLTFAFTGLISQSLWGIVGSSLLRAMRTHKLRLCINCLMAVLMIGTTLYALYS
ncbi:LysE family translocator [Desulfovibrio sp. UCD-KL4C]|uniref:LysE family translocator n=1 Tax=Desulfovibrio sp. UCD-KL4C TaxID=2578120 RepID=UPI0025BB6805|nr:LysE family translocator [Desulfovibrio sp. UCD-KL4C]